ncbi:MAG: hypothetical protein ACF8Q5_13630 [Phycisphaerales bacterium JB040]
MRNTDTERATTIPETLRRVGLTLCLACAVTCPLGGCERAGVEEQRVDEGVESVPEAAEPAGSTGEPAGSGPSAGADGPIPGLAVPPGWTLDPEPRTMRLATYIAPDAGGAVEVALSRFGGRVGGELANINRWRGQMGLEPVGEGELESVIERYATPGFEGYQTRIESERGVMLAAGVYEEAIDQTWFVRATAPDPEAADRLEAGVFGMARSIAAGGEGDGG